MFCCWGFLYENLTSYRFNEMYTLKETILGPMLIYFTDIAVHKIDTIYPALTCHGSLG